MESKLPKIYIASLYSRRAEMEQIAMVLESNGFPITARWVYGGEDGLDNQAIAELDLDDVDDANLVLSFSCPYGTMFKGGGRCVEFGYGIARGKESVVIGERENVFHWLPDVKQFDTLDQFISSYV